MGRNTYTVLYLEDLLQDATAAATQRVEGRLDKVEVSFGVNEADVAPSAFAYVGAALQRQLQARAGDVVACRLRPADPDHVPVPPTCGQPSRPRAGTTPSCANVPPSADDSCSQSTTPPRRRCGGAASYAHLRALLPNGDQR